MALPGGSDADDIYIGRHICSALGRGKTPEEISAATISTGVDKANAREIIDISVLTFCPQFAEEVAAGS